MDHLQQARSLYQKYNDPSSELSHNDSKSLSVSITKLVRTCLVQQGGLASLKYLPFLNVIQRTVAANNFQGEQAAAAFFVLEKYLLFLFRQPWKREFWRLKTYGGYFCTKVKAHLDNPEEILQLVGFMKEEESSAGSCLVLDHSPDIEIVLNVAFDCQVAAEECLQIGEYHEKMKCVGLSLSDAMKVLLSGPANDPATGPPVVVMPGQQHMQIGHSNIVTVRPDPERQGLSKMGPPLESAQTFMASGGMGMGIVMGASTMHQVTGVPATRPVSGSHSRQIGTQQPHITPTSTLLSTSSQYTYPVSANQANVMLKVDLPRLDPSNRIGEMTYRPHPSSSQPLGSRVSYASSTGAQSSAYGSGAASVLSTQPSSAFTASSGYHSGALPQPQVPVQNYIYPSPMQTVDHVDSPLVTTVPCQQTYTRHTEPLRMPHTLPSDFPYIDEEEPGSRSQFPEATHEEHLRESLRNLQTGPEDPGRKNMAPFLPLPSSDGVDGQAEPVKEGVPVSYDDWRWFRPDAVGHNTIAGTDGMMVQQSAVKTVNPEMMRYSPAQPATSVIATLNVNPNQSSTKKQEYPSHTVMGNAPVITLGDRCVTNNSHSSGYVPHNGTIPRCTSQSKMQPVYYPPAYNDLPFQQYTSKEGALPTVQKPPFNTMARVPGRPADKAALLSRQPLGSNTAILNNLDKGSQGRLHSAGQELSGASSEIILRDKTTGKSGPVRGSSLVTSRDISHPKMSSSGRQSSQSMDLGMLKWRCQTCTMENPAMESICSACSKSRGVPELQFPIPGETKRACPVCTYENPSGCSKCEVCSNALSQDVHTYV